MALAQKTKNYLKEKPLRLTQIIILLTGVVLAFSYALFFKSSMDNVRDNATFLRLGIVETSQAEIENFINTNITALEELSKKMDLTNDPDERQDLIEKLMREKNWITEIAVTDQDGNETANISKYSISSIGSGRNASSTEEFQIAGNGELYLGKVRTDDKSIPILTIALPVKRGGHRYFRRYHRPAITSRNLEYHIGQQADYNRPKSLHCQFGRLSDFPSQHFDGAQKNQLALQALRKPGYHRKKYCRRRRIYRRKQSAHICRRSPDG